MYYRPLRIIDVLRALSCSRTTYYLGICPSCLKIWRANDIATVISILRTVETRTTRSLCGSHSESCCLDVSYLTVSIIRRRLPVDDSYTILHPYFIKLLSMYYLLDQPVQVLS